ncbi:BirA family transcriptional regulator, biotin operon repressor / biotin-[acetyl-CoA-carboxylase] ligase [Methylobacterium sp. ap11]|uniref:biotin--[acetyl-CoA-carboxylase] ligase n=1 Tax=Methylobacterium sp. ap11 TaxID=1761799 RepID=UPI0008D55D22|nr:biotin--[acetyl-CoA-carboxylase] ligase [Methylobacterium sp. ap11]SEP25876.1 BirA family transcriptional regulator, biotin operon repressor / biotin-[acetyl-CoA-carboxylase] ligase [Methylobacterium sp. ap11]
MTFVLDPAATAAGYRLEVHDSLGSTSTQALARARAGEPGPLWVVTREQTGGRGRRGKGWSWIPGNHAASLLWPVPAGLAPDRVATLGFVAGVAVERALRRACGPGMDGRSPDFRLKWPNDVLLDGAKLVGILLEMETLPDRRAVVTVGIGVNVAGAPDGLPYRATSLAAAGYPVDAPGLFRLLSAAWVEAERLWDEGRDFSRIRDAWLGAAAGLGGPVNVQAGGRSVAGTFETIDEGGRLVVRLADGGHLAVSAGEVHFGTAATAA